MMKLLVTSILILMVSCQSKKEPLTASVKARSFNKKALDIYMANIHIQDSIELALKYIDSAIHYDSSVLSYYLTKAQVLQRLEKYNAAITSLQAIPQNMGNDYRVLYLKAEFFRRLSQSDSSKYYYLKTNEILDADQYADIFTDSRRVLVYFFIGDSLRFNDSWTTFQKKYKNDPNFSKINLEIEQQIRYE